MSEQTELKIDASSIEGESEVEVSLVEGDVTEVVDRAQKGKEDSVKGFSNEYLVVAVLMRKYFNVSKVDLPLSSYDVIVVLPQEDEEELIIRCQVKTANKSIKFTGGTRGGVDREYVSGVKEYIQSTKTSDVVVGVDYNVENRTADLYFIPTILIEILGQKSISLSKVDSLKNNYEMLEQCKNREYVLLKCKEFGIIKQ